jgi:hypothetical protein
MSDLYDPNPAPAIERLARIEGQSNFLSLLAGVEAGPDTTQDMAALAFSRAWGATPEVLEAWVAQSGLYRWPLMSMCYARLDSQLHFPEKDRPWVQGAVADAFLLLRYGQFRPAIEGKRKARPGAKPVETRAKQFRVDKSAYGAMRNCAAGEFEQIRAEAHSAWTAARSIRQSPTIRQTVSEPLQPPATLTETTATPEPGGSP